MFELLPHRQGAAQAMKGGTNLAPEDDNTSHFHARIFLMTAMTLPCISTSSGWQ